MDDTRDNAMNKYRKKNEKQAKIYPCQQSQNDHPNTLNTNYFPGLHV